MHWLEIWYLAQRLVKHLIGGPNVYELGLLSKKLYSLWLENKSSKVIVILFDFMHSIDFNVNKFGFNFRRSIIYFDLSLKKI